MNRLFQGDCVVYDFLTVPNHMHEIYGVFVDFWGGEMCRNETLLPSFETCPELGGEPVD